MERTKQLKNKLIFVAILDLIFILGPILFFIIKAIAVGEPTQKLSLGLSITVAIIILLINIMFKLNLKSAIFILVLGIHTCLDNIQNMLLIYSICMIVSELIICPIKRHLRNLYVINKEIDKR